jgi:diguanylate cyclase (GGDEF)-like protein
MADEEVEDLLETLIASPLDDLLDDEPEEELDIEPFDEAYDDDVAKLLGPEQTDNWNLDEKYIETSILKLNIAMMKNGVRATEVDSRLRAARGRADTDTVRSCLAQLKEDCETYLAEQAEASEKFVNRIEELGELSALGEEVEMTNLEQAAQIETTLSNLASMDFESDLESAVERLLEELKNLRMARHKLRDNQEAAFLTIARYENRLEVIEPQLFNDPLTGLRNRIGLEVTLAEWWKQGRHKSRQFSVALLDVDRFGPLNERHGSAVCDRILQQLGRFVENSANTADVVARFAGQRFFILQVDLGPRTAMKNVEIIRQKIEKTTFVHGDEQIRLTLCGGITEVVADDRDVVVLKRLERTVAAAKNGGSNRLFTFDSSKLDAEPELVESPSFGAQESEIIL